MDLSMRESQLYPEELPERPRVSRIPFWVTLMRPIQLILSFVVLALAAYVVNTFGGDFGHTLASSILSFGWTVALMLYIFVVGAKVPKLYHRFVHLGIEFVTLGVWIGSFSLFVQECQAWDAAETAVAASLSPQEAAAVNSVIGEDSAIKALRGATWLCGADTVLFAVTLMTCSLALRRIG